MDGGSLGEEPPRPRTPPAPRGGAATATELRAVRADLEKLQSAVLAQGQLGRDTARLIAETIPRLADIDDRLAHAEGQVAQLLDEPNPSRNPPPVHWPTLPAAEAEQRWTELAEWVATILVDWLDLTRGQLPDCWPRHRPAVLELSWLRSSYLHAYLPASPPHIAAE